MRHWRCPATLAVGLLSSTMRVLSGLTCLVTLARSPHLVAPPAASACFAAIALTAVAASANRKHRAATWRTTMAWPKALNMTMRRTHPMNIYGLMMIDNLIAPAAPDDVASRPRRQEVQKTTFSDDRQHVRRLAQNAVSQPLNRSLLMSLISVLRRNVSERDPSGRMSQSSTTTTTRGR